MDSAQALVHLWQILLPEQAGQYGREASVHINTLKVVLSPVLTSDIEGLADAALAEYFQPDDAGFVSFIRFWEGLERMMSDMGMWHNPLIVEQSSIKDGFRMLRRYILDRSIREQTRMFNVHDIRRFIEHAIVDVVGVEGSAYWRSLANSLHRGNVMVTEEEVAMAIWTWLQDDAPPSVSPGLGTASEAARSGRTSWASSSVSEDSLYEGRLVQPSVVEADSAAAQVASIVSPLGSDSARSPRAARAQFPGWPQGPPPSRPVRAGRSGLEVGRLALRMAPVVAVDLASGPARA
mmetsp:Transcript_10876/g.27175  ORF Transcript_10876/g.27175 Transcript_10876/m.27175 type:complete len:293 (+) Transcript_10876:69-947(+)